MNIRKTTVASGTIICCFLAAGVHAITLDWNANTETDIAGYRLYYGTASAPYANEIGVTTSSAAVANLKNGATYTFAVTAYNGDGFESAYSDPISYTVGSDQVIPAAILANISTRAVVDTGENVLIGGFIIEGIVPKKVALRAIGPSLAAAGILDPLGDPVLQLADSTGKIIASNDNWNVPGQEIKSYGLAPTDSRESALVVTLAPGAYSAIVSGNDSASGVGLFELYDLDPDFGRVANISTRSRVETGDNVMIGGFILSGASANNVIVRALGPSLGSVGIHGFLHDPSLEIYDSNGILLGQNDNWRGMQEIEIIDTQIAPTDDRESALVLSLFPGAYTSIVRGSNDATGVALVEVYALN